MAKGVLVLVATIPSRFRSCERLLAELPRQSQPPDGVLLVLDGYGDAPAPKCGLPIEVTLRTTTLSGPGGRWRVLKDLDKDQVVINIDDDTMLLQAPNLVRALVAAMNEGGGAAAAMGRTFDGKQAPPGLHSRGRLLYAAGCGLAVRAGHLAGLQDLADTLRTGGGPDALGPLGDDDALISAHLWKREIPILHAATGNVIPAPNTRTTSQTEQRKKHHKQLEQQKVAIAKATGWPWLPAPTK